ncbi:MAG: class I SAM-dependent methyltransferase [Planctomycetes bacterium]|nr:class I SAM-dependent methyltransferase [Planctomycetota bacterium]
MRISDIPTDETVTFITSRVRPAVRILEVGAGRGEVAQRLRAVGHSVVAIDSDADAVEAARRDEIEVVHADFLAFCADPFDAIVFTRSLHHLSPLTAILERARALVRSDGTILIEDFAFEEMNQVTADWLHNELPTLRNDGVLNTHDKGFGAEFLAAGGDLPVICQESTPNEGDQ